MSLKDDLEPELVVDCWDQLDEKVIDSQLDKLTKHISKISTSQSHNSQESSSSASTTILTMYDEPEFRPQIIQRPVTILRRTESSQASDANDKTKTTKAFKTFEQRQQEYAEARLRIMGAAKNPEDETANDDGKNILKSSTTASTDLAAKQMNGSINGYSNKMAANQPSSINKSNISNHPTKSDNAVTRQPIGPDGSSGFSFRR